MELIRALFAAVLLVGPLSWLRRTSPLAAGWHPVLVLSVWALSVLTAGIGGHLLAGVVVVVLGSLALLAHELIRDRPNVVATMREPAVLVFGVTGVVLAVVVHGALFTHYDNFSQWALVVSVMLHDDALPTSTDEVVGFPTYPLGGASLAYLANRLIGPAEWVSMLAHDLFIVSCALPLVSLSRPRRLVGVGMYAVAALALLTHITSPTSLLVDSAVAGLAGVLFVLLLLERPAVSSRPLSFGVVGATLVVMKTSGVFFVAVATILALLLLIRTRPQTTEVPRWAAALGLPWAAWALWDEHVRRTFPHADTAKHSVSIDRFESVLAGKSAVDVRQILGDLAEAMLQDGILWLLLLGVVGGALAFRSGLAVAADRRRVTVVTVVTVVLWEVSLCLMYLSSMPLGEALALAGFRRYQGTIHLVVMLVLLGVLVRWAAATSRRMLLAPVVAITATLSITMISPTALTTDGPDQGVRRGLQAALGATGEVHREDVVCLLQQQRDNGYRAWIVRFLLMHRNVRGVIIGNHDMTLPKRFDECAVTILDDPRPHTLVVLRRSGFTVPAEPSLPVVVTR